MSKSSRKRAMALLLSCLCLGASTAAGGGLDKELPSLDGLVRYGCTVQGPINMLDHSSPQSKWQRVWSVTFWAEHKSTYKAKPVKDWELSYSYRTKRIKALVDCDRFMERVKRATRKHVEARRQSPRPGAD